MTHEFVNYSPEEQKEFLNIVKKMEWKPKEGDWFVKNFTVKIVTEILSMDHLRWYKTRFPWLPQVHDLLEELKRYADWPTIRDAITGWFLMEENKVSPPIEGAYWFCRANKHLCLTLARCLEPAPKKEETGPPGGLGRQYPRDPGFRGKVVGLQESLN